MSLSRPRTGRPPVNAGAPPGVILPCLPTLASTPPSGGQWVHEIKLDGYRLMVRRRGDRVRLITRNSADWTERYPRVVAAALALPASSFLLDAEATWCRPDGMPDFEVLHSRAREKEVGCHAFDLLELDGEDLRAVALEGRKERLANLLASAPEGLSYVEHAEGDGAEIFAHACRLGFEGIVSKRRDLPYRSGLSKRWLKIRNPRSAAMLRYEEGTFGSGRR